MNPLLPGKAELRAANLKSLLDNPAFQEVFMKLVQEGVDEAKLIICKATETEQLFKAAGQLKACETIQRSIDALIELGERKRDERLTKITQENLKDERRN